jgi:hypothetical protein
MCDGDRWRLIAMARQVLVHAANREESGEMKGSENLKKLAKKKPQKTLKERRAAKRAATSRVDPVR